MPLYIKVLTDYYDFLIGDLEEKRKVFLMELLKYLLLKDEYGYDPFWKEKQKELFFYYVVFSKKRSLWVLKAMWNFKNGTEKMLGLMENYKNIFYINERERKSK